MAHFARLDENNIVVDVIVVGDEYESTYAEWRKEFGEIYVQTSYNNNIRKQYATIGGKYDSINDIFIKPQPYPSWVLDSNYDWQAPIASPDGPHIWDEETKSWINLS